LTLISKLTLEFGPHHLQQWLQEASLHGTSAENQADRHER